MATSMSVSPLQRASSPTLLSPKLILTALSCTIRNCNYSHNRTSSVANSIPSSWTAILINTTTSVRAPSRIVCTMPSRTATQLWIRCPALNRCYRLKQIQNIAKKTQEHRMSRIGLLLLLLEVVLSFNILYPNNVVFQDQFLVNNRTNVLYTSPSSVLLKQVQERALTPD